MRASLVILLFASISAACGQLLFKIGAAGRVTVADFANRYVVFGLILYALGTAAWIYALSSERLTTAYAFTGLTFVFVYMAGVFVLHEKLSMNAVVGVLLVVAGVYLIAVRSS